MYAIIYNVVSTPRERMVVSAALLIRERGAQATAISDVLKHSGAPRGSAYHYFPGGRMQLLEEATDYAGAYIAGKISAATNALDLLDHLIDMYRHELIRSDYRAGCPIVAVTVEAGDPDNPEPTAKVIERAGAAFELWTDLVAKRLSAEGATASRAEELAMLVTTAIEGAILVARASRDVKPLDVVHRQLRALVEAETGEGNHDDR
jgi:AcrR family transcriptional regulator